MVRAHSSALRKASVLPPQNGSTGFLRFWLTTTFDNNQLLFGVFLGGPFHHRSHLLNRLILSVL